MPIQPDAILQLGGIKSAGHLDLYPGLGSRTRVIGEDIASIRARTRTTGALASDYSLLGLDRAGVLKWTIGNNTAGDGADDFTLYRDADGIVADATAMKITRSTLRVDFYGEVYADGVQLGTGAYVALAGDTMTGTLTIAGATGSKNRLIVGDPMPGAISTPRQDDYPLQAIGYNTAKIFMVANIAGLNSQFGASVRVGAMGMSNDGGIRFEMNHHYRDSDGAKIVRESDRPDVSVGLDGLGGLSYSFVQATDLGAGTAAYQAGQALVINSAGGWGQGAEGVADANLYIFTPQAGRKMWFGTSSTYGTPVRAIVINAASGSTPGTIDLHGTVVIKEISGGRHGLLVLGAGSSDPSSGGGTIFFNGSAYRAHDGTSLKTIVLS